MGKRRLARELAMQMLFQRDLGEASAREIFARFRFEAYEAEQDEEADESPEQRPGGRPGHLRSAEAIAQILISDSALMNLRGPEQATELDKRILASAAKERSSPVPSTDLSLLRRAVLDLLDAFEHAKELVSGTVEHLAQIDELIRQQAEHWRIERMPPVDRNVLRLAVYELLHQTDVPKLVVVDEAVELAKRFGAEQSGRFVNGLLDGLLKSQSFPGSMT